MYCIAVMNIYQSTHSPPVHTQQWDMLVYDIYI